MLAYIYFSQLLTLTLAIPGGVVTLRASTVLVEGEIHVDGQGGNSGTGAAGSSGGSVYIVSNSFSGFGTITANGGGEQTISSGYVFHRKQ